MIRYTIAICTHNRSDLLQTTLQSLTQLHGIADPDVEVLVVDNASQDATSQVLQDFLSRLPLRVEQEDRLGHCFARNHAVQQARGDLLLWTDDDVELAHDWLAAYRRACESADVVFWGGPIIPRCLGPTPRWLTANWQRLAGCYAQRDLGQEPLDLDAQHLPYGANFAVRRQVCLQFPFDVALGRRGDQLVGEDERDFLLRLLQHGHRGRWVPDATVWHLIPPQRLTLDYLARYFAGQAAVQWYQGQAPAFTREQFAAAARHHQRWWRWTRWCSPSSLWLDHWIKWAMFQHWAQLAEESANPGSESSGGTST